MNTIKPWELEVSKSKENLWLITTQKSKLVCVKFRSKFFVKDGGSMLPVKVNILSSVKL